MSASTDASKTILSLSRKNFNRVITENDTEWKSRNFEYTIELLKFEQSCPIDLAALDFLKLYTLMLTRVSVVDWLADESFTDANKEELSKLYTPECISLKFVEDKSKTPDNAFRKLLKTQFDETSPEDLNKFLEEFVDPTYNEFVDMLYESVKTSQASDASKAKIKVHEIVSILSTRDMDDGRVPKILLDVSTRYAETASKAIQGSGDADFKTILASTFMEILMKPFKAVDINSDILTIVGRYDASLTEKTTPTKYKQLVSPFINCTKLRAGLSDKTEQEQELCVSACDRILESNLHNPVEIFIEFVQASDTIQDARAHLSIFKIDTTPFVQLLTDIMKNNVINPNVESAIKAIKASVAKAKLAEKATKQSSKKKETTAGAKPVESAGKKKTKSKGLEPEEDEIPAAQTTNSKGLEPEEDEVPAPVKKTPVRKSKAAPAEEVAHVKPTKTTAASRLEEVKKLSVAQEEVEDDTNSQSDADESVDDVEAANSAEDDSSAAPAVVEEVPTAQEIVPTLSSKHGIKRQAQSSIRLPRVVTKVVIAE